MVCFKELLNPNASPCKFEEQPFPKLIERPSVLKGENRLDCT